MLASTAQLTVPQNSGPAVIGIATPNEPYQQYEYAVTINALPSNGTVIDTFDGSTVAVGETFVGWHLSGLAFRPTPGLGPQSSMLTYTITDPLGASALGSATLTIGNTVDVTVAQGSAPMAIGIPAPNDPNYSASQLTISVTGLPTNGSVTLADGVTPVTLGESLTVSQLTGLRFRPMSGLPADSGFTTNNSGLTYSISDPSGLFGTGAA